MAFSFRLLLVSNVFFSVTAFAFSLPKPGQILPDPETFNFLVETETGNFDFTGIAKLNNCSGSIVRFENSLATDKAMILTNGHCVQSTFGGFIPPNEFIHNESAWRSFRFLNASGSILPGSVEADKIIYATMTGSDIAFYQLTSTFEEIEAVFGITPLTISNERPSLNTNIEILSGYWRKGYSCSIESFVYKIKEENYVWNDSVRYSRPGCETIPGTSGSPVIDASSREVIAINNTGNESGEECTMNNPCEVDEKGNVSFVKGYSYAQQTYIVYSCLNEKNEIDLSKENCKLFH